MITLKQHEERLNQMYADIFTEEEAVERLLRFIEEDLSKNQE